MGLRLRLAWGRRREGPDLPAPPLPELVIVNKGGQNTAIYPFYEEFSSPEQAAVAAAIRNQGKDIPAPPLASESTE